MVIKRSVRFVSPLLTCRIFYLGDHQDYYFSLTLLLTMIAIDSFHGYKEECKFCLIIANLQKFVLKRLVGSILLFLHYLAVNNENNAINTVVSMVIKREARLISLLAYRILYLGNYQDYYFSYTLLLTVRIMQ